MKLTRRSGVLTGLSALVNMSARSQPGQTEMDQPAETSGRLAALPGTKVKVFDPKDGFGAITSIRNFTDSTIFKRDKQWWMVAAGFDIHKRTILLFSASLPVGASLAAKGWMITAAPGDPATALPLVPPSAPGKWDSGGGMHCPSYARGRDPGGNHGAGAWQERVYYAASAGSFAGPYSIGYLEWDGSAWRRYGDSPVLTATETWETPTVAEPNVIYFDDKWRIWYAAGPDKNGQFLQGYAESVDGRTNWKKKIYVPGDEHVFDNAVIAANNRFECVLARYSPASREPRPADGLWWHSANYPSADAGHWSKPIQLLSPLDGGAAWHAGGVWKPSFQYSDTDRTRAFVFFDGTYSGTSQFPIFTLGCIECHAIS